MAADKEIFCRAAEIVSVQEGGRHRDGDQEDLDGYEEDEGAMVGHPDLVAGAPVEGEELVYFAQRKVSIERKLSPVFYSVYDDAVEVGLKIEVKVLEPLADDGHGDVQQRVELEDVDGLDVVAMPEAQAHQAHNIGCDQNRVRPETPLRLHDLNFMDLNNHTILYLYVIKDGSSIYN